MSVLLYPYPASRLLNTHSDNEESPKALHAEICRLMLRPIVSILLRCGMTFREFARIAKSVFVQVAVEEYGINGRPTNTSRVALLTGMSRNEVKQQRDRLASPENTPPDKVRHAAQVLFGWHTDPDFLDGDQQPLLLPPTGSTPSFEALYDKYGSRDIPATTVLKELDTVHAIGRTDDGRLQALTRYFMPAPTDSAALQRSAEVITDLASTVHFNLYREQAHPSRFEGRAHTPHIPRERAEEFRTFIEEPAQQFLEQVDDWLSRYEDTSHPDSVRIGIGVFEIRQ